MLILILRRRDSAVSKDEANEVSMFPASSFETPACGGLLRTRVAP